MTFKKHQCVSMPGTLNSLIKYAQIRWLIVICLKSQQIESGKIMALNWASLKFILSMEIYDFERRIESIWPWSLKRFLINIESLVIVN